jgi:predicted O-linked N-acetylglucosamine transferase (SPINDLY family)
MGSGLEKRGQTPLNPTPLATPPAPAQHNGHITFGSFNNTAKLNTGVIALWARTLAEVPGSRLILKWRTFNDEPFKQTVLSAFEAQGIAPERIELRGPSFDTDLLKEYADIDIALDPFPFTGGLTSCEALYMGVPVVTWPQSRVISRQTFAFLSAIDLPELAAKDARDYLRIAVEQASNPTRLQTLHNTLRRRMQNAPLCNPTTFTRQLESSLIALHRSIGAAE